MTLTSSAITVQGEWNPQAQVSTPFIVDAIDASLLPSLRKFAEVRIVPNGKTAVLFNGWVNTSANTLQLPDGTDIDIVRNRGLVHLQDWHNWVEFDD